MNVTKYVCKELKELDLSGSIVNVTSVAVKGMERLSVYGASKAAVTAYTKAVGRELGRLVYKHRINCISSV